MFSLVCYLIHFFLSGTTAKAQAVLYWAFCQLFQWDCNLKENFLNLDLSFMNSNLRCLLKRNICMLTCLQGCQISKQNMMTVLLFPIILLCRHCFELLCAHVLIQKSGHWYITYMHVDLVYMKLDRLNTEWGELTAATPLWFSLWTRDSYSIFLYLSLLIVVVVSYNQRKVISLRKYFCVHTTFILSFSNSLWKSVQP